MATQNQGWAFVSGSSRTAGGSSREIQWNNSGFLEGDPKLKWQTTEVLAVTGTIETIGGISASINVSASAFYGDGANLTGLTASAVEVADGPEFSIQFRKDDPISGEISGSADLMWITGSTDFLQVTGAVKIVGDLLVCSGTASISDLSGCSPITVHSPVSSSQNLSASAFYFGPGGRQQISDTSTDMSILAASTGMFISADGGNLTLQGQVAIDGSGVLSSSTHISASRLYVGDSIIVPDGGNIGSTSRPNLMYLQTGTLQVKGDIEAGDGPGSHKVRLRASGDVDAAGEGVFGSLQTSGSFGANRITATMSSSVSWDGDGVLALSASAWGAEPTVYAGFLAGTASYGGRLTIDGPSGSLPAYLGTSNIYVSHSQMGNLNFNYLDVVNNAGPVKLSSSNDLELSNATAYTANYIRLGTNVVEYTLNTSSLGSDDLEYAWSINSDHTGPEEDSAWVKLDLDGGEFVVGGADNIKLSALRGLEVSNVASTFNSTSIFKANVTASADLKLDANPGMYNPNLWISSSVPSFGPGKLYGRMFFGSGSISPSDGQFTGAALSLSNFAGAEELKLRSRSGGTTIQSDGASADTTIKSTDGEVILSGSEGVISHTAHSFSKTATFNAGFNVNNEAATFNNSMNAWGNVNIGNAHSDDLTVNSSASFNNMGNINSSASNIAWQIHSGSYATGSGPGQNGALLFFSSASVGGNHDYLKFHTSTAGPGPAVVFPALTIFNSTISASSNVSGAYFYGDGSNLTNLPGGGAAGIFTEINGTQAATTSSVAIGQAGAPAGVFQVSGSLEASGNSLLKISGDASNDILVVTGSGRVGIRTAFPDHELVVSGNVSSSVNISASAFYGDFKGDSFINTDGHLTIQNTVANKKIINLLGSTDSNTSFQIRNSAGAAGFAVDGAGTAVFTPTGILQISSAGVLSSSANVSASAFYARPGADETEGMLKILATDGILNTTYGKNAITNTISDFTIQATQAGGSINIDSADTDGYMNLNLKNNSVNYGGLGSGSVDDQASLQVWSAGNKGAIEFKASAGGGQELEMLVLRPRGDTAHISGSTQPNGAGILKVSGDSPGSVIDPQPIFFVTGSGRVGIGTSTPSRHLEISGSDSVTMKFTSQLRRAYTIGSNGYGFMIFDDSTGGTPGYRFIISDTAGRLGYTGIGSGLTSPQAQLHVSSSEDISNYGVFRVDGDATPNILFVTGSGRVGIGTATPAAALDILGDTLSDQLRLGHGGTHYYKMGRGSDGFFHIQGSQDGYTGYTFKDHDGNTVVNILPEAAQGPKLAVTGSIMPGADNAHDLGSSAMRWANVYTGDLHLANDRGNWTVVEESDYLTIRNNKTGKRFKLLMEEID